MLDDEKKIVKKNMIQKWRDPEVKCEMVGSDRKKNAYDFMAPFFYAFFSSQQRTVRH